MKNYFLAIILLLGIQLSNGEDLDQYNSPTRFDTIPVHMAILKDFLKSYVPPGEVYQVGVFDCKNFAKDLIHDAHERGIQAHLVIIGFTNTVVGHAVVGFPTADAGTIYADATSQAGKQSSGARIVTIATNQALCWYNLTNVYNRSNHVALYDPKFVGKDPTNVVSSVTEYPQQELYKTNGVWLTRDLITQ